MTRLCPLIFAFALVSCSLGTDVQGGFTPGDTGADLDAGGPDTGGDTADLPPVDTGGDAPRDLPDADTPDVTDEPHTPDVPDTDEPDVEFVCDEDRLELCPEGTELNTIAVACDAFGGCLYDCDPGFRDIDNEPGCECSYTGEEVCDGFDNNCDGTPDEGLDAEPCREQMGVCQGSVAGCGEGVVECDDEVYGQYAAASGLVYDASEPEVICDGQDNDCNGRTDDYCCPVGELWNTIEPMANFNGQVVPTIARRGEHGAVAWLEVSQGEIADVYGISGVLRYAYVNAWGEVTEGPVSVNQDERSSLPHIERSERNDRFVVARVAHGGELDGVVQVRQREVHNRMLKEDAEVYVAEPGAGVDGIDQSYVGNSNVLVTWSVRPLCVVPGCGTVYARAVSWMHDDPRLGPLIQVSSDDEIAWSPRIARVGDRSLVVYRYDRPGMNDTRLRGLRWQVFEGAEMVVGSAGETPLNPNLDEEVRDWEVFPLSGRVGIVLPAPPNGEVRFLVVDPQDPEAVQSLTLNGAGPTTVATGFGGADVASLMWWSPDAEALEFSTVSGGQWTPRTRLRAVDERGTPSGVAAVGMSRWGLVATTSKATSARLPRIEITAVNRDGARLCPPP